MLQYDGKGLGFYWPYEYTLFIIVNRTIYNTIISWISHTCILSSTVPSPLHFCKNILHNNISNCDTNSSELTLLPAGTMFWRHFWFWSHVVLLCSHWPTRKDITVCYIPSKKTFNCLYLKRCNSANANTWAEQKYVHINKLKVFLIWWQKPCDTVL